MKPRVHKLSAMIGAVCLGSAMALATSAIAPAVSTQVEHEHDALSAKPLSAAQTQIAEEAAKTDEFVTALLERHGGDFGEWQVANIEGDNRGAFVEVTLREPAREVVSGLRPDTAALAERYAVAGYNPLQDYSHGAGLNLDKIVVDDDYPLEVVEMNTNSIVTTYTIVVDLPTRRVISAMPLRDAPEQAPTLTPDPDAKTPVDNRDYVVPQNEEDER